MTQPPHPRAFPRGLRPLIAAQFMSALADNALLIVAIALLQLQGRPGWWAPLLKICFMLAYVLLAPFVGVLADAVPKGRWMMAMNALKVAGLAGLLAGLNPLAAMLVVGVGAAAYAPAKYGLVTELVPPQQLVAANGWIEVTTVLAALGGTVLGGLFVSLASGAGPTLGWPGAPPLAAALGGLLLLYAAAALLNLAIPDSGARYRKASTRPLRLVRQFLRANRRLWRDVDGGLSLAVTTLFWGAAAVLQFAVLRWAGEALGLTLAQGAYLQAAVAVGVVAGAAVAGRCVALHQAKALMVAGVLLGLLVPLAAWVQGIAGAVALLLAVGALGGALVVPMNALLQHRGHALMSAGRSIAVQGFNENLSVLAMLAAYAAMLWAGWSVLQLMALLGLFVATIMALLTWQAWWPAAPAPTPAPSAAPGGTGSGPRR